MISVMRRYRKSLQVGLLVIIAAFVASLFVLGSSGSRMGGGEARDRVATVNGESIPMERFQRRYQSYLEAYAQMYRDRFSNELAERLGLPQQVVGDLVLEALIVQRAQAEGLAVTDEELNARTHAIPAFQENGRFSSKRYQDILKRRGFNPPAFEGEIRRELTRAKVESAVRGGAKGAETELAQAFRMGGGGGAGRAGAAGARRRRHRRGAPQLSRGTPRRIPPAGPAARAVRDAEPEELHADGDRRRGREVLPRARQGVREPAPGSRRARPGPRPRDGWKRGGGQGAEQGRRRHPPREGRGGLRHAGAEALGGFGGGAARRRPRAREPRRGGAAVRAGAVRAEEGRGLARAGPHAVRLPRDQGDRHPGGRPQAPEGRRGPDPAPPRGRGRRPGREGEGRADPAAAAGREGFHGRGEEARARAGRDDNGQARSRARSGRHRYPRRGGVRPHPGGCLDSGDHAGGPGPAQARGDHSRGCAAAPRDQGQGDGVGQAPEGGGDRARAR